MKRAPDARPIGDQPTVAEAAGRFQAGTEIAPGIRLVRELGAGGMGSVWLADHAGLGQRVAVKILHAGESAGLRERLLREAELTARIEHPNVVRLLGSGVAADGSPYLVLELVEGESLGARIAREGKLALADVGRLVAEVAAALEAAHAGRVVHRDVKPSNVMLTATGAAKVVDFGIARAEGDEVRPLTAPGAIVGTLAYMSPEQLIDGRPADVRSDLWALAALTYEALTGRPPFAGKSRAMICAAMVLRRFERPSRLDATLPPALDAFFDAALALEPELRFPSARELAERFAAAARGEAPPTEEVPRPATLRIPETLFGREREIAAVHDAFRRAAAGRSRVLFVSGYSGIGKTSLVAAVEPTLVAGGATFVSGKFDQFNRGTPYDSLIRALRTLIRKTLAARSMARDDTPTIEARPSPLAGPSGRALIEVIPELEELIGPQPPLDRVSPEDARNRFRVAVERLVASLATAERPLVLFFDDLHWADLPSIDLITSLATDPESRHVLFVGAYRDNEIDAAHPLTAALERLATSTSVERISLGPLGEDAVLDLVSATFPGAAGRARLAAICHQKTHGNALFLRRLLEALSDEGALRYQTSTRQWTWDLSAIEARAVTGDVVDFVAAEIRRMAGGASEAIAAAACVGDTFDLETLAVAVGEGRGATLAHLRPALASELLLPAEEEASLSSDPRRDAARVRFRFAHDRIRQAARTLVDEPSAARIRLRVARFMLADLDEAERERRLFELVDHLNAGVGEALSTAEAKEVRSLNLRAARRATSSAAFQAAYRYLRHALDRLEASAWDDDYTETFAMHVEGARAAYLGGDHETMRALVETAARRARSPLDRVRAREVELSALVGQQRLLEVVRLSIALCGELGLVLPPAPTPEEVGRAVAETVALLEGIGADDVARIPMAHDETVVAILRIQNATMSSAYLAVPNLLPIMGCNIVRMTMESGICAESPYGFAILGLVLSAGNHIDAAHRVGKLATELLGRVEDRSVHPRTLHVVSSFVRPFVEPLRGSIDDARRVFRLGMDTGDFEYAAWGLHTMVRDGMFAGLDLDELETMYERTMGILEHHRQVASIAVSAPFVRLVASLRGRSPDPACLSGPGYDETAQYEALRAIDYRGAVFVLSVIAAYVRFVFGDLPGARTWIERASPYRDGAVATYNQVWFHQLRALILLGAIEPGTPEAAAVVAELEPDVAQLRTWQRFAPANHDHRVLLVEAEIARVCGHDPIPGYEAAIARAKENRFAPEVAIASERLHRHLAATHDPDAPEALARAIAAYERWGATAKVGRLRARAGA